MVIRPTEIPTPRPTFAPVERPDGEGGDVEVLGREVMVEVTVPMTVMNSCVP